MSNSQPTPDAQSLPVTIYTPESPLVNPFRVAGEILSDVWTHRELIWILFARDLKAQYRQSYLGYVWVFVPIIATTISWMYLHAANVIQPRTGDIPYPLFVLSGSLVWTVFTSSVNQPLGSFLGGKDVFMKLNVPVESFILAGTGRIVFNLALQILFLIPVFAIVGQWPSSTAWLFPLGVLCTVPVGLCIGVVAIPIGSLYADVGRLLTVGLSFAMLLSPVAYLPPTSGFASLVMRWNPMTNVIMANRDWLITGRWDYVPAMATIACGSLVILVGGMITLGIAMPRLVERMGM